MQGAELDAGDVSRSRTVAELPVSARTMMSPNWAGSLRRPTAFTCISKGVPAGAGDWPILPAATWMFCSAMACCTSTAVMPRLARRSGLSQMRME